MKLTFVEMVHGGREVEAREPFNQTSFVWLGTNGLTNACLIRHVFDKEREDIHGNSYLGENMMLSQP